MLGCSVYLDKLSERIKGEMELPSNMIFYSFDATPLRALVWDEGQAAFIMMHRFLEKQPVPFPDHSRKIYSTFLCGKCPWFSSFSMDFR